MATVLDMNEVQRTLGAEGRGVRRGASAQATAQEKA